MTYDFQLTYSVKPRGSLERHKKVAHKARDLLKNLNGYDSLENIETTLIGKLSLTALSLSGKRNDAETKITTLVRDVLKNHEIENEEVYHDVDVYLSLMVDGLGKHIEFQI